MKQVNIRLREVDNQIIYRVKDAIWYPVWDITKKHVVMSIIKEIISE
jgi:hypothetical protein